MRGKRTNGDIWKLPRLRRQQCVCVDGPRRVRWELNPVVLFLNSEALPLVGSSDSSEFFGH